MPLKVNVGLSKKTGLPDYGSLGASVHVEYEADSTLLHTDLEAFHRQVKGAFIACKQAVQDELSRHQSGDTGSGSSPPQQTNGSHQGSHARAHANGRSNGQHRSTRKATASQVRAINSIGDRLQLDLAHWLHEKFGLRIPSELSISDASHAIDELKALPSGNHHGGRG